MAWGAPVGLARALRIAAEIRPDDPYSRAYRYLAVALLGAPDGSVPGPAALEYIIACEDLARQRARDLPAKGVDDVRRDQERRQIAGLCRLAQHHAQRYGAVPAWLRIWDVAADAERRRNVDSAHPVPFMSQARLRRAEVGAAAMHLQREQIGALFGCSPNVITQDRRDIHQALSEVAAVEKVWIPKPFVHRWLLFRRVRNNAVAGMFAAQSDTELTA